MHLKIDKAQMWLQEWMDDYKLYSIPWCMGMVPKGVVQYPMGTVLCDSPERDDIIFLGEILQQPSSHSLPYDLLQAGWH